MSQKYVVVNFFDHFEIGYNFPKEVWLRHVTLMPLFSTVDIKAVQSNLEHVASLTGKIKVQTTGTDNFGPKKDKPVLLLDQPYKLSALHAALINIPCVSFTSPEYNAAGYRPHITLQKDSNIQVGEKFTISCLTLVDMYPGDDINRRQVMANYALGG